jgi:hypothetical protein
MSTKTRAEIANEEATRDPIFLFQRANVIITDRSNIEYCGDCKTIVQPGHKCPDDGFVEDAITTKELIEMEAACIAWDTELVFATREEGEAYGKRRHYNYINGWRVFCVPAEGTLKSILADGQPHAWDRAARDLDANWICSACGKLDFAETPDTSRTCSGLISAKIAAEIEEATREKTK